MDNTTPMRAIRAKCLDCSNGSPNEVRLCPIQRCPLYPYRFGRNPNIKPKEMTEEQKSNLARRLASSMGRKREDLREGNDTGENGSEFDALCSVGTKALDDGMEAADGTD